MENREMDEEFFALKFEIDTLAEIALKNESERWMPGFIHAITENDHVERYNLVCGFTKEKTVLDIACGTGRGAYMIKTVGQASVVKGCDLDPLAIRYAQHRNSTPGILFEVQNAEKFISEEKFDTIVSFETIEHLSNYSQFLTNCKTNLIPEGQFFVSTPISSKNFDTSPINPYHVQEWGFLEFQNMIGKNFKIEKIYVQLYQNSFINEKLRLDFEKNKSENKTSFQKKLINKLFNRQGGIQGPHYLHTWNSKLNYSKLELFDGQYPIKKLGSEYVGYQILICRNV